jgi:hypothetical protein
MMTPAPGRGLSHHRREETAENKARWFQSLTLDERMDLLCEFTDLALSVDPHLASRRHAESINDRGQIAGFSDNRALSGRNADSNQAIPNNLYFASEENLSHKPLRMQRLRPTSVRDRPVAYPSRSAWLGSTAVARWAGR